MYEPIDESVQKSEAEKQIGDIDKKNFKEGVTPNLENIVQCLDAFKDRREGERFILYCKV